MSAEEPTETPRFTIITGLSGAGRSEAAKVFEDLGYFVIDNLPPALIDRMASLTSGRTGKVKDVALVVDARGGEFFPELERALAQLGERGIPYRIVFFEATDEALVRRFEESRRPHPLTGSERVIDAIVHERKLMSGLRDKAHVVIDTSGLNVHELREKVASLFVRAAPTTGVAVNVISFGYKYGIPLDADMVFDCRFLPNPHWVKELRPLSGADAGVREYVLSAEGSAEFLEHVRGLLGFAMPGYVKEGRHYITIGVGCTGGRHRSVVLADETAAFLREQGFPTTVVHRDVERE